MENNNGKNEPFGRLATGIDGLDRLLNGGFLRGGTYLLMGPPGSGKTILANQICFHSLTQGANAVYLTLLAESHIRMFGHLQPLHFFDRDLISNSIQYMSGYNILEKEGLDGLMRMISELTRKHQASLLFIDGVASADELAGSPVNFKKFVHNLNSVVGLSGATTFLLSSVSGERSQPEHTMVDGIVHLNLCQSKMRTFREIEIQKFRGSDHMSGQHYFNITNEGLTVFPRIEALVDQTQPPAAEPSERLSFGSPELDSLLGGGLLSGSVTSLLGPPGSKKTSIGMMFLHTGARQEQNSMLFSLYEHPNRLVPKLKSIGIDIAPQIEKGNLILEWQSGLEIYFDEVAHRIISLVEQNKIRRLFIDGVGGLLQALNRPERLASGLTALTHQLRALNVTTLITEETPLFGKTPPCTLSDHSGLTDNILSFSTDEYGGEVRTSLSVTKTRGSASTPLSHRVQIGSEGLTIGEGSKTSGSTAGLGIRKARSLNKKQKRKAPKKATTRSNKRSLKSSGK